MFYIKKQFPKTEDLLDERLGFHPSLLHIIINAYSNFFNWIRVVVYMIFDHKLSEMLTQ